MTAVFNPHNLQVDINALTGRLALKQTETALSKSIRNLSSGIRIHSAKDDPAGFTAATAMQTEITSTNQAVKNAERANSVIATVDNALAHLDSLMNDLRGLVTQAASTGGESPETLASLQLQADAVLSSIDFISAATKFNDQKLLDGSLDFTTFGLDKNAISKLVVNQANFLGRTEKDISVQVFEPPQQAALYYPYGALKSDTTLDIGGTGGYQSFSFDKEATVWDIADAVNRYRDSTGVAAVVRAEAIPGSLILTSNGLDNDIILTASVAGRAAGNAVVRFTAPKDGNDTLSLNFTEGYGNTPCIIEVVLQTDQTGASVTTAAQVADLINTSPLLKDGFGNGRFNAALPEKAAGSGIVQPFNQIAYYGDPKQSNQLQFLAPQNSPKIRFVSEPNSPLSLSEQSVVADDGTVTKDLIVHLETDRNGLVRTTANDLVRFFDYPSDENSQEILKKLGISVSVVDSLNSNLPCAADPPNGAGVLVPTYNGDCPPQDVNAFPDIVFGSYAASDFPTESPPAADNLGAVLIGASDGEGLGITFYSVEYGSQEFVSVLPFPTTDFPLTDNSGIRTDKTYGKDIVAQINGQWANGNGRIASACVSDLDIAVTVNPENYFQTTGFRISGGGTLLQLGQDAVSEQQARIGIPSVHSTALGGTNGYLSQLRTGEPFDLLTDTAQAYQIVMDVTKQIAELRGRLGAFQKNQVETVMNHHLDSIEIESGAKSGIADVDFAAQSSEMARQQVLMQANISVLQMNSQRTQMLLGLLQG
ncbi:MAG: hypothetical protein LBN39_00720 [Planctomycetaceae bacterium]|jgi:flagellin|nr:hypothetical protein [Planctomycetaceae bacterium]